MDPSPAYVVLQLAPTSPEQWVSLFARRVPGRNNMNTPIRWNASVSGDVQALQSRWKEVRKGLQLFVLGYCFLVLLAVPGLALLCFNQVQPTTALATLTPKQVTVLGWILTGTGMVLAVSFLLLGQCHCLGHAPQRHGSRELMFTSLLCTVVGAACLATSWALGGTDNFKALIESVSDWRHYPIHQAPELLQLSGALLLLFNLLLLSAFLRALLKCVAPSRTVLVSSLFWAVGFLGGATIGFLMTPMTELLVIVCGGWVVTFLWHLALILFTCWSIRKVLAAKPDQFRRDGRHSSKPPSGLHRHIVDSRTR
jgi:hypothetical protein